MTCTPGIDTKPNQILEILKEKKSISSYTTSDGQITEINGVTAEDGKSWSITVDGNSAGLNDELAKQDAAQTLQFIYGTAEKPVFSVTVHTTVRTQSLGGATYTVPEGLLVKDTGISYITPYGVLSAADVTFTADSNNEQLTSLTIGGKPYKNTSSNTWHTGGHTVNLKTKLIGTTKAVMYYYSPGSNADKATYSYTITLEDTVP